MHEGNTIFVYEYLSKGKLCSLAIHSLIISFKQLDAQRKQLRNVQMFVAH